jgi:hypothetical protein
MKRLSFIGLCVAVAAGAWIGAAPSEARAQGAAAMSCDQLWYARNAIYARRGYCFNTDRAREIFGAGCFPPYGKLSGWEKARVNELQMWEGRRGC